LARGKVKYLQAPLERRDVGMNIDEAIALQERLHKQKMEIRRKKGHDYADENIHKNFDALATICKLLDVDVKTPYGCAMYMKILKLQREANLIFGGKKPANEAIIDTLLDESNYNDLELEILVRDGIIKID
jgi:hypothetical protein